MTRVMKLIGVCGVAAMCSAVAIGQATDSKKTAQPSKPADSTKAPAAGGKPDMEAMMQACMTAAEPGKMHHELVSKCGVWEGKCKMWMDPSAPPQESTCTTTISPMFGGRFTKGETVGMMDMGGHQQKFEGFGLYGYNNTTEKFEASWCDSMGTMIMNLSGDMSSDGKTITWNAKYTCPMTKKDTYMREVERMTGADTMVLEMYGPNPADGKEMKMMEISYTRKPGTATKHAMEPVTTTPHSTTSADK